MYRLVSLTAAVLILAGCAARGPAYQPAPAADQQHALIYIYRPYNFMLGGRDSHFSVDATHVADLSTRGYTYFYAPAGNHTLVQKWPLDVSFGTKTELGVHWTAGRTYIYRFAVGGEITGTGTNFAWTLASVPDGEQVQGELAACKLQPASGAEGIAAR